MIGRPYRTGVVCGPVPACGSELPPKSQPSGAASASASADWPYMQSRSEAGLTQPAFSATTCGEEEEKGVQVRDRKALCV